MTWSEARKQLTRMKRDLSKKIKEMRKNIFMSFTMFSWARDTWQALHQWHLFNMVFGDHWWIWSKNKPIFRKKKRLCCLQRGKWLVIKDWIVIWIGSFISDGISFLSNKQTAIGRILRIVSSIIALYDYKQFSL